MAGKILISTAYLPPIEYLSLISDKEEIFIEKEENYIKQTYRNRCYILSSHGLQLLTVPVYLGSVHKTLIKDIRIDYSKRWQQVHLGAITASYSSSPFYLYYFEVFEKIISQKHEFILDLNMMLLESVLELLKLAKQITYTSYFESVNTDLFDYRYLISPKTESPYQTKIYQQVFQGKDSFVPNLSIIDLLFNMGPESGEYM